MNNITTLKTASTAEPSTMPLEQLLTEMARFGKPRLSLVSSGWHCCVDMNTNTNGTSFEVKSDFGMSGPAAAAIQCRERITAALKALEHA